MADVKVAVNGGRGTKGITRTERAEPSCAMVNIDVAVPMA